MSIEIKYIKNPFNGHRLFRYVTIVPPIPPGAIRVRTSDGLPPIKGAYTSYSSAVKVDGYDDVYDVIEEDEGIYSWDYILAQSSNLYEVLGSNPTNVVSSQLPFNFSSLEVVSGFTIGSAQVHGLFANCADLTSVALFDTSNVTSVNSWFNGCTSLNGGALAFYNQLSTQANPPTSHTDTFTDCGIDTVLGLAELQQIPASWGGLKFNRATFIDNTSNTQVLSFGERITRVQFMVLPKTSYTSQLATCNNGISTGSGVSVFWVTEYSIDSDGALHVKGRKADYDFTRANANSGWPTMNSSTMYYYGSQSFDGVSSEAHKFGVGVPSDAVAVLLAYKNQTEEQITCHTMETNRVYNNITDVLCGMCKDSTVLDSIASMGTGVAATFDIAGSNMIYPLQSNRTILCGPREFLTSL